MDNWIIPRKQRRQQAKRESAKNKHKFAEAKQKRGLDLVPHLPGYLEPHLPGYLVPRLPGYLVPLKTV
jgi:hypothetical protein